MSEIIKRLNQPLNSKFVKSRKKAGQTLSYLPGYAVEKAANEVFEHKYSSETVLLDMLFKREYTKTKENGEQVEMIEVAYQAKVRVSVNIDGIDIVREGYGAGNGQATLATPFDAYELAIKEAETDAKKRALKSFGDQFGLSLYDKEIDLVREYEDAKRFDLEFIEMQQKINASTDTAELKTLYKTYNGSFKEEVLALILLRLKELKRGAQ
jgi:DNA repair and recombination protein RAD52